MGNWRAPICFTFWHLGKSFFFLIPFKKIKYLCNILKIEKTYSYGLNENIIRKILPKNVKQKRNFWTTVKAIRWRRTWFNFADIFVKLCIPPPTVNLIYSFMAIFLHSMFFISSITECPCPWREVLNDRSEKKINVIFNFRMKKFICLNVFFKFFRSQTQFAGKVKEIEKRLKKKLMIIQFETRYLRRVDFDDFF